ncbi:UNVERIFIED_CONTAM: hypothetical protein RMT77_003328 [Armadillidium vulgare]
MDLRLQNMTVAPREKWLSSLIFSAYGISRNLSKSSSLPLRQDESNYLTKLNSTIIFNSLSYHKLIAVNQYLIALLKIQS